MSGTLTQADLDEIANAVEYTAEEVMARPIPAKCPRCRREFLGREAILAPSLDNVACFYCGPTRCARLVIHPKHKGFVTAKAARELAELPLFATVIAKTEGPAHVA